MTEVLPGDSTVKEREGPELAAAREQLERALQWEDAIFEGSRDAIFISDADSRFIAVNQAACDLTGYTRPELLRLRIPELLDQAEREAYRARHARVMRGEEALSEEPIRRKDGSRVAAELNDRRILVAGMYYMHTSAREVSERNRAAADLRASEERYRTLFEENPLMCFTVDAAGLVADVNRAAAAALGYAPEEIVGRPIADVFVPEDRPEVAAHVRGCLDGVPGPSSCELREIRRDGGVLWVVEMAQLVPNVRGRPGVLVVCENSTERKHAEELQASIYEISAAAHRARDLHDLFAAVHRIVGRLMDARNFYIALYESDADLLTFPYFVDQVDPPPLPTPPGRGLTGYVVRTGRPLLATPEVFDELCRTGEVELRGAPSVDWLGVPLIAGDHTLGALVVQTYTGTSRYGEREKEILAFVSGEVAQAVARKRAEETLRRGEERFRRLFNNINDAVFVHGFGAGGLPGTFTEVNDVACQRLGYTREELLRMGPADIDAPEGWAMVPGVMDRLWADGHAVWEGVHVGKDGRRIPVEISNHLFDLEGKPTVLAAVRDITERRRSEERMRRLNDCFLGFTSDPAANVGSMVAVAGELLGASFALFNRLERDQLVTVGRWNVPPEVPWTSSASGHICTDVVEDGGEGAVLFRELARTRYAETDPAVKMFGLQTYVGQVVTCGNRAVGSLCMLYKADFEPDAEDAKLLGIVASAIGVEEERRRALAALRGSERLVRSVLDAMVDAVVITAGDGTIMFANPAAEKLTGAKAPVPPATASVFDFIDPAEAETVRRNVALVDSGNENVSARFHLRRVDGSQRLVETVATRIPYGDGYGRLVTIRDVTERVRLEEQLRQAQKMEAVGRLAGGIAHDFNNVLQALLSLTQALGGQLDDPARFAATASELREQVERGAALTRQLLLFSRQEAPRLEELDLNEVVRRSSRLMRRLLRENIVLSLEPSDAPVTVMGDGGQLEQVLVNLTVNAADAMPSGGKVTIRTEVAGGNAVVAVADTGVGIAEQHRARIFEPFFTTKDPSRGTGLGLSVVHGIVTNHRGRIEVETEVGRGTTFRVLIPAVRARPRARVSESRRDGRPRLAVGGRERVLVVEDEAGAREGIAQILTMLGYDVTATGSGAEADALAADAPFDLLLTDQLLPDTLGTDLALRLSARWPAMSVVLMSGYTDDEALRSRISHKEVRFLQKPFDMETLASELRAALDERVR